MGLETKVLGKVRGIMMDLLPSGREDEQIQISGQAEQLVAFGSAPYQEIVRQGRAFYAVSGQVASVTAIPTTAHTFAIYNNESDGGRSLIIDQVGMLITASASIIGHAGMIGCLSLVREAIPTATGATPRQCNGMGNSDTKVKVMIPGDAALPAGTGIAANWFPIGDSINAAVTSLPGFQKTEKVDGRFIVPPGRFFGVHCLSAKTDIQATMFIWWHEKILVNG